MIKGLLLYHYHLITFFLSLCPKKKKNEIFMKADYPSVLLIYTGGTIGMIENPETAHWKISISTTCSSMSPN